MNKEFYRLKFKMSAETEDTAEIMIYSEIASENFWGDETTTGDFDKAIKEALKRGATKLNLRINSGGGEVYAAVAMRSMVMNAGFEEVRVMIEGLCASAATLFATIPGAHVVIADGSEFMIHNPMTITWGNAKDLEKTIEHLHSLEEQFHDMYAQKSGQSTEQIKAWMDETKWFKAKEAVEYHFCDELLDAEPVAACVTAREMGLMKAMYARVSDDITVMDNTEKTTPDDDTKEYVIGNTKGSNEDPVAGFSSVNTTQEGEPTMEIKDITREQLLAENPALAEEIRNSAIQAERERQEEIDALCVPGYEAMAEEAKRNGTSAMDFQKAIVKAMKDKGSAHIAARQQETAPAAQVVGASASDTARNEDEEIKAFAKEMAGYVEASKNDSMF